MSIPGVVPPQDIQSANVSSILEAIFNDEKHSENAVIELITLIENRKITERDENLIKGKLDSIKRMAGYVNSDQQGHLIQTATGLTSQLLGFEQPKSYSCYKDHLALAHAINGFLNFTPVNRRILPNLEAVARNFRLAKFEFQLPHQRLQAKIDERLRALLQKPNSIAVCYYVRQALKIDLKPLFVNCKDPRCLCEAIANDVGLIPANRDQFPFDSPAKAKAFLANECSQRGYLAEAAQFLDEALRDDLRKPLEHRHIQNGHAYALRADLTLKGFPLASSRAQMLDVVIYYRIAKTLLPSDVDYYDVDNKLRNLEVPPQHYFYHEFNYHKEMALKQGWGIIPYLYLGKYPLQALHFLCNDRLLEEKARSCNIDYVAEQLLSQSPPTNANLPLGLKLAKLYLKALHRYPLTGQNSIEQLYKAGTLQDAIPHSEWLQWVTIVLNRNPSWLETWVLEFQADDHCRKILELLRLQPLMNNAAQDLCNYLLEQCSAEPEPPVPKSDRELTIAEQWGCGLRYRG